MTVRKAVAGYTVALAALVVGGTAYVATGHTGSQPSATHVVAVWIDGLNHFDLRQACSVMDAEIRHSPYGGAPSMKVCETRMASSAGYDVRVIPHTEKQWKQPYHGRTARMASVRVKAGPYTFVVFLHGSPEGWLVANVKQV